MKVTLVNQFYLPDISPTASLTASLAQGLAAQGHEVTVIASQGGYVEASKVSSETTENPRVLRVWTPKFGKKTIIHRCIDYLSFYIFCAMKLLFLKKQDVIISLTTPPFIVWTGIIHRFFHRNTKLVLWNMDCYPDAAERAGFLKLGGLASKIMRAGNRMIFRRLDHLIALDSAMLELLMSQYGPKNKTLPTTIIPNWENASFFPANASYPAWDQVEKLGLKDRFVVLYLGNTGVGHPFESVIEAAKLMRDEPVTFLFVGGGKRMPWLEETVKKEGLTNVVLHGYVQKNITGSVMAAAGCALITLEEKMLGVMSPSKLHSNLALGLPILYIGPQKSNVDDAITRFDCGVSLRPPEHVRAVEFIRSLMKDKAAHEALRTKSRAAFDAAYCDTQTIPQFLKVLDQVHPKT